MTFKKSHLITLPLGDSLLLDRLCISDGHFNMEEIWKDIPSYEGLYQASNLGRIRSMQLIKKTRKDSKGNYELVDLSKNKKPKTILVHRLVALAFIENTNNKPCVNHINGIKTDNRVENLEWVTMSENLKHSWDNGLHKKSYNQSAAVSKMNLTKRKPVSLVDKNGMVIKNYISIGEAASKLNVSHGRIKFSIINNVELVNLRMRFILSDLLKML